MAHHAGVAGCAWKKRGPFHVSPDLEPAPRPVTLAIDSQVFGVNEEDQLVERIHGDLARGAKFVAEHWDGGAASTIVGAVTHGIVTPARDARGRVVPTVKAQAQHKGNGGGGAEGEVPDVLPGMELSPIGQTEQGATPHDQARCLPFQGLATCP